MKDQIEFHFAITETPFTIDPANIRLVYKHLDGSMIATTWGEELEVSESWLTSISHWRIYRGGLMVSEHFVILCMFGWITWTCMTNADKYSTPKERALQLIPIPVCFFLMGLTLL